MYVYEITRVKNVITFITDHGEAYGGERSTSIDTEGKVGEQLYKHIAKYAGSALAKAARDQGFC